MQTKLIAVLLMVSVALIGCETVTQTAKENPGAAVGAGVGGAAGVALGGSTQGRVVGGLLGALVGGAVGHYVYDRRQDRDETAEKYDYTPESGTKLEIEEASADPQKVRPGESVEIKMTYALLNPSEEAQTQVTEVREILYEGEMVGRLEQVVNQADGTYTSTVPIQLPEQAEAGTYQVKTTVKTPNETAEETTTFTVG